MAPVYTVEEKNALIAESHERYLRLLAQIEKMSRHYLSTVAAMQEKGKVVSVIGVSESLRDHTDACYESDPGLRALVNKMVDDKEALEAAGQDVALWEEEFGNVVSLPTLGLEMTDAPVTTN